jgi:hypothetical protein
LVGVGRSVPVAGLDAIFTFFSSHPNIQVDQKRKFYEELLHLPPELATKTGEELREALAAGLKYVTEHPTNLALGKELSKSFSDLRETLHGVNDDMVEAFGGDGAKLVIALSDAIKHNVADIKQMRDDWMAIVDKIDNAGRIFGFHSDDPNDPAQKKYDEEHKLKPDAKKFHDDLNEANGRYQPMAFREGGDELSEGVKIGMLAAFREWFASTGAGGSGYQRANYTEGGNGGGNTGGAARAAGAFRDDGGFKVLPNGGDYSNLGGSVDKGGDVPSEGNAGATSFDRARFAKEIENTPGLKEKIFQLSASEDRPSTGSSLTANQAVMETMMNRAAMRRTSLAEQAKWYGREKKGYYAGKPSHLSALERANSESNLKAVLAGSNITNYATDNSSGGLAAREKATGKFKFHKNFHGESFFSPGWAEPVFRDRYSAMRNNDLLTAAKGGGVFGGGAAQKVTGDASLSIDLNGFPKGTKTDLTYGGLFISYNLSRGRQMEASEQK